MGTVKPKLAVAAAIVLAGVAGGAYVLWPKSPARRAGCFDTTLSAAAKVELAADARRIEYTAGRASDGTRDVRWSDPVTGRSRQVSYDASGRITDVFGELVRGRSQRTTWLEYDARRALVEGRTVPRGIGGNGAGSQSRSYRDQLRRGSARVVGVESLAGRRLLHIRVVQRFPQVAPKRPPGLPKGIPVHPFPAHTLRIDTWLDPDTFLPVVTRTSQGTSGEVSRQAWLPRTPANVASTIVRIPRGFTVVHPQQGSGQSFDLLFAAHRPQPRCAQS